MQKPENASWLGETPSQPKGGAKGIRTPDLLIANETRYQLRHSPMPLSRYLEIVHDPGASTQKPAAR